tara:strand:+ start:2498 stop:3010 length:513 start_codon:yes stop_codon:yes gene_type:complete
MSQLKVNSIIPVGGVASGQGGGIIQTCTAFKNDSATVDASSGHTEISSDLRLFLTPKSTSSKILITATITFSQSADISAFRISRLIGSTTTDVFNHSGTNDNVDGCAQHWTNNTARIVTVGFSFIDSPNTTSEVRYTPTVFSTTSFLLNRIYNSDNYLGSSSMIGQEISA